ncbi:MAG: type 4a pilus biogenesis protein PilO [Phycisphaerales bacterium]|nr:type 4a pilus biogenesis protein PilO [Phycisphaerales bacterium]
MNGIVRQLGFIIVMVAVPLVCWYFVFQPQNALIDSVQEDIQTRQEKLDEVEAMAADLEDLESIVQNGLHAIELIESKLPRQQDVESILEQVWQTARSNGLVVKSVRSKKPVTAMVYMEQPLDVELEGPFEGFYAFMLAVEKLPRITRIFDLELAKITHLSGPSKDELPLGSVRADFTLSIYFSTGRRTVSMEATR